MRPPPALICLALCLSAALCQTETTTPPNSLQNIENSTNLAADNNNSLPGTTDKTKDYPHESLAVLPIAPLDVSTAAIKPGQTKTNFQNFVTINPQEARRTKMEDLPVVFREDVHDYAKEHHTENYIGSTDRDLTKSVSEVFTVSPDVTTEKPAKESTSVPMVTEVKKQEHVTVVIPQTTVAPEDKKDFVTPVATELPESKTEHPMMLHDVSPDADKPEPSSVSEAKGRAIDFTSTVENNGDENAIVNASAANTSNSSSEGTIKFPKENIELDDKNHQNVITDKPTDMKMDSKGLDDVSMDYDEAEMEEKKKDEEIVARQPAVSVNQEMQVNCVENGTVYKNGQVLDKRCDGSCRCTAEGTWLCTPRCAAPYQRRNNNDPKTTDPLCDEKPHPDDECCSVLVCAADAGTTSGQQCIHRNVTYNEGDRFQEGCESLCVCGSQGIVSCEPRCPKSQSNKTSSERCVSVQDPQDPCCTVVLCDVTLDEAPDHDVTTMMSSGAAANATATNKSQTAETGTIQNIGGCDHAGKHYALNEEFHRGCAELCVCTGDRAAPTIECLPLDCPSGFGLDVVDPNCLRWEPDPPGFRADPPHCCPEKMRCVDNGTCTYKGQIFENWSEIPSSLSGCEERCYCESGTVDCRPACPPSGQKPTACPPGMGAVLLPLSLDDECCKHWTCGPVVGNNATNNPGTMGVDTLHPIRGLFDQKSPKNTKQQNLSDAANKQSQINKNQPQGIPGPFSLDNTLGKPSKEGAVIKPGQNSNNPFLGPVNGLPGPFSLDNAINPTMSDKMKPNGGNTEVQNGVKLGGHYQDHYYTSDDEDKDSEYDFKPDPNNPGPGFFNPSVSKTQYHDFDVQNNGQQGLQDGPPKQPPRLPQLPQQTHHVLGLPVNGQLPPGVRIEHLLQHLSGGGPPDGHGVPPHFLGHPGGPQSGPGPLPPGFPTGQGQFPGHFVNRPGNFGPGPVGGPAGQQINVMTLEAIDPHTVRLVFSVPHVLVGLHGRVELRYTSEKNNDNLSTWPTQIFAPPDDLIATPQLEFELGTLRADTEYRVHITLILRDLTRHPESEVYKVRTPPLPAKLPFPVVHPGQIPQGNPAMIPIEPQLVLTATNSSSLEVAWRKLAPEELQFVDGVQLRYKELEGKVYAATPLIHRSVTSYTIEGLKPSTSYDVGIFFIPFPGQTTELRADNMLRVKTAQEVDVYGFEVIVNVTKIKATTMEVSWSGVPYPEDKFVNVYRAIYQSETGKEDSSVFKVAKRDSSHGALIKDLKPGTRYRLWLEVYLTNGKIKKTRVLDLLTKPGTPQELQSDKLSLGSVAASGADRNGDYYGPLVVVAVIASLAVLSTLVLLLILTRRRGHQRANITPPSTAAAARKTESAYDNPTYKVEIQQETMNL